MDELCDSMYWIDLNAHDDNVNLDNIIDNEESGVLKDTDYMDIQQINERP